MMRLYEIKDEFIGLYEQLESGEELESGEVLKKFNEIDGALKDKLENTTYICKDLKSSAEAIKEEAKRLTQKAKSYESKERYLRGLMKEAILSSGELKHKTDKFNFSVSSTEKYNYDELNTFGLDSEFVKIKEEIDKNKIKAYVKAGGVIDGLKVTEETTLTIR